jgi:predicted ATPase/DNA-binding SARP family transcriptional activator
MPTTSIAATTSASYDPSVHPAAAAAREGGAPASAAPTGDLPIHLTHFVGRARELDDVRRLLGEVRLLTLTGAGGSGKTRLATEAAARWPAAASGARVTWADLTPVAEGAHVPAQIAAALHLPGRADVAPLEAVRLAIGAGEALLVLDNCEHVIDAAAAAVDALLRACPGLRVLATSREALGVGGETAWHVPALAADEAAQLFAERARATQPAFVLTPANRPAVDEICRRLDGVPLAIELAAARVRALAPEAIAARLDDAFRLLTAGGRTALPRHRTLRATMEWSHGLLSARERALLRRLAVFAGGFTLASAEAVCADDALWAAGLRDAPTPGDADATLAAEDVLDGVAALVDKSLVVMGADPLPPAAAAAGGRTPEPRYRLLETVRQYGLERLAEAGEREAAEASHTRHFLDLAAALAPDIVGGLSMNAAMARLGAEQDNLRAATSWALQAAERDPVAWGPTALCFGDHLFWYWYGAGHWLHRGQFDEARRYTTAALRVAPDAAPTLRARAQMAAGLAAHPQGDFAAGAEHFRIALAIGEAEGDRFTTTFARAKLAAALLMLGDVADALTLCQTAWTEALREPPNALHGFAGVWLAFIHIARGDLAAARVPVEHCLRIAPQAANQVTIAHCHALLGRIDTLAGDHGSAAAHLRTSLELHLMLGDAWGLALDLEWSSALAAERGRHADFARLAGAVDALRDRAGMVRYPVDVPDHDRHEAAARAQLAHAYDTSYAEGRELDAAALQRLVTASDVAEPAPAPAGAPAAAPLPAPDAPPVPVASEASPSAALRVLALGGLQVYVGDRPIDPTAWGSARTRELLAYLVAHPEGRTKEQVGLALWPEASSAQLRNNFHVTLHRLRRALGGADWVSLDGDRYRIPTALVAEFDAQQFAREVAEARRALAGTGGDAAATQLERALARYRGDFLDGEAAGDWHLAFRDHLQRLHVEALQALGTHHLTAGRPARAADAFRRLLARDPLREEAAVALMRCHAAQGEPAQALRVYRELEARLRAELGAAPCGTATALAAELRGDARPGSA